MRSISIFLHQTTLADYSNFHNFQLIRHKATVTDLFVRPSVRLLLLQSPRSDPIAKNKSINKTKIRIFRRKSVFSYFGSMLFMKLIFESPQHSWRLECGDA